MYKRRSRKANNFGVSQPLSERRARRPVGIRIVTHTTDDRHTTGAGLSFVIHTHTPRLGGSLVLLFVFIDVREMIPYHRLRMPLVSWRRVREGIRFRNHVGFQQTRLHRVRQR